MKNLFFLFLSLTFNFLFSQQIDTTDIFTINNKSILILKPEIEKKINSKIQPTINQKFEILKNQIKKERGEFFNNKDFEEEFKLAKDTIRINEFLNEYENSYSMATTTMGMNWKSGKKLEEYDKLLNEYYKKAQSVLTSEMQKKLIESQKKWLSYYENEKKLISDLNDFGNQNSSLYCWAYYLDMIQNRVFFLRDIYQKNFQGIFAFKSNE